MPEIDTDRVGLYGVSQANWYMPLVAESATEVGFIIVLTGGVMPVGINVRYEELIHIEGRSIEEAQSLLKGYSGELGFDQRPPLLDRASTSKRGHLLVNIRDFPLVCRVGHRELIAEGLFQALPNSRLHNHTLVGKRL